MFTISWLGSKSPNPAYEISIHATHEFFLIPYIPFLPPIVVTFLNFNAPCVYGKKQLNIHFIFVSCDYVFSFFIEFIFCFYFQFLVYCLFSLLFLAFFIEIFTQFLHFSACYFFLLLILCFVFYFYLILFHYLLTTVVCFSVPFFLLYCFSFYVVCNIAILLVAFNLELTVSW